MVFNYQADSVVSIAENAQHDPHCPWFLIGVNAPALFQSIVSGTDVRDFLKLTLGWFSRCGK